MLTSGAAEDARSKAPDAATDSPLVAISILNWNGWQDTLECLESVRGLDYPNYLTVVVDNGSRDESAEKIKAWAEAHLGAGQVVADYTRETALAGGEAETERALDGAPSSARLVLIRNPENLGFTGGNNVAIHYALSRGAAADYVFFLNNDALVQADCLTQLTSVAQASGAGIIGAVVTDGAGHVRFAGTDSFRRHFFRSMMSQRPVRKEAEFWQSPIAYGAAMLVRRETLKGVYARRGMYLNDQIFAYGDELDFCYAASLAGYGTVIARDAVASHRSEGRKSGPYNARFYHYYATRNILLLANRMLPLAWKVFFHLTYLPICTRRAAKMLLSHKPDLAAAIAHGLMDGYKGTTGRWKHHERNSSGPIKPDARVQPGGNRSSGAGLSGALRRLSYRPEVVAVARSLHIAPFLKRAYCYVAAAPDDIFKARVSGIEARFFARTPGEWRRLEGTYAGAEEVFLQTLVSTLRPGQIFYDVGSNIGEYAVFLAKAVGSEGKVVAFEPVRDSYERIQAHARLNELANVRAYHLALADKPGEMKLEVGGFLNRQSRLVEAGSAGNGTSETVEVTTGDRLRERDGLPIPNAVKIDVEGYEYQVLKGMKQTLEHPSCTLLCCEVHPARLPAPLRPEDVAAAIRGLGFSQIEVIERGTELHLICRKEKPDPVTA